MNSCWWTECFPWQALKSRNLKPFSTIVPILALLSFSVVSWSPTGPFLDFQRNRESLLSTRMPAQSLSCVWLSATPWTVAHQAPLSIGFSRQEYWSGLLWLPPGDFHNPGIEHTSTLQAVSLPTEPPGKLLLYGPQIKQPRWKPFINAIQMFGFIIWLYLRTQWNLPRQKVYHSLTHVIKSHTGQDLC